MHVAGQGPERLRALLRAALRHEAGAQVRLPAVQVLALLPGAPPRGPGAPRQRAVGGVGEVPLDDAGDDAGADAQPRHGVGPGLQGLLERQPGEGPAGEQPALPQGWPGPRLRPRRLQRRRRLRHERGPREGRREVPEEARRGPDEGPGLRSGPGRVLDRDRPAPGRPLPGALQPLADDDAREGRREDRALLPGHHGHGARARDDHPQRLHQLLPRLPRRRGAVGPAPGRRLPRGQGRGEAPLAAGPGAHPQPRHREGRGLPGAHGQQ
mmetsp:Transcript_101135/g.326433  ORF Transcript_101135/g.326433 Transcript_101135/m.326433 type:complete len:268 (-) Transcript_101135:339-1142(-)